MERGWIGYPEWETVKEGLWLSLTERDLDPLPRRS